MVAPAVALVAVVLGILVGEARGPADARAMVVLAVLALVVTARTAPGWRRVAAIVFAVGLLGGAAMQRALDGLTHSPLTTAVAARADITARVTLVEDPDATRWSASALVRVDAWSTGTSPRDSAGGRRVLASASGDSTTRLALLAAGEGATVRGWLAPLDGFDTRMKWRHAVATLHVTDVLAVARPRDPLARLANRARSLVLSGSEALAPVDRAVLAGFLLGDTRAVPDQVEEQFRAAGLTHLTAVSGGNVAFVLALVAPLLRRLRLGGRLVTSLAVLVLFGTMTRWEPSVARAITMAVIGLLAGYLGRPTAGVRVLVLAAGALLLVDPFLVHSVGFLLSCAASLGIALWARPIARWRRGPMWLREVLAVSAAAQLGVAPVLVPVFGSIPLVALPANLVAVPLAAPLTMWGIVAGVANGLIGPIAPSIPRLLAVPTAALVHALLAVADVASRVPIALDGRALAGIVALGTLVAAAHRARSLRRDARPLPAR
ncbi:MAG TPA: ComEC/Rec2 family competence protein [Acidimicrobiia bacterium]|nr:ComEC/Rec2 family competence protein [Acidimicrobiia bacterium]